jgi:DNA-binding transcriptional ArsR family regulator
METKSALRILSALAQETRLAVFRFLAREGGVGVSAGEIAGALSVPATTLSFHLKELSQAGLVEAQREGRSIRYALRADRMREFLGFLSDDCCQGHPELCLPLTDLQCGPGKKGDR